MSEYKSELTVITKAKDMCRYVTQITHKSPKEFRFTYTVRLQNYCLNILEALYRANDVFISKEHPELYAKRYSYMRKAINDTRLMMYMAELSREAGAILPRHYEQISKAGSEVIRCTGGWINSDRKRLGI